jgi:uncharacterized protein YkwD
MNTMYRLSLACLLALTTLVPAAHAQSPVPGAPAGWFQEDIGGPNVPGGANVTGTTWAVAGSGVDIQGTADQFHYVFTTLTGDGGITARILSQFAGDGSWTKTGVMLRESDAADSRMATFNFTSANGSEVGYRTDTNGSWSGIAGGAGQGRTSLAGGPIWLRVQHKGTDFQVLLSDDGQTWRFIDHTTIAMDLTKPILAGLDVTSHTSDLRVAWATFDNVSVDHNVIVVPGAAPTATTPTAADLRNLEDQVFALVNQARAAAGLPPYNRAPELDASARAHSLDMAATCNQSHTGSDGSQPWDRMTAAGYNWRLAAENIASGQTTAAGVFDTWFNEAPDAAGQRGHRDNILNPTAKDIGISVVFNGQCDTNGYFWTQDFGARR